MDSSCFLGWNIYYYYFIRVYSSGGGMGKGAVLWEPRSIRILIGGRESACDPNPFDSRGPTSASLRLSMSSPFYFTCSEGIDSPLLLLILYSSTLTDLLLSLSQEDHHHHRRYRPKLLTPMSSSSSPRAIYKKWIILLNITYVCVSV